MKDRSHALLQDVRNVAAKLIRVRDDSHDIDNVGMIPLQMIIQYLGGEIPPEGLTSQLFVMSSAISKY